MATSDITDELKPVTLDQYFEDIDAMRSVLDIETDVWVKTKTEDVLFLISDGIEWAFACSDEINDFKLYFNYYV